MTERLAWPHPVGGRPAFGVIGWPVEQSLSPNIHLAAFAALELDADYFHLPVPHERMRDAMAQLQEEGFRGANVTMPHKDVAAEAADLRSPVVERLGAANTLSIDDGGRIWADNTDVGGFADFLALDAGVTTAGLHALIYGGGGAARACALALLDGGIERLVIAVRRPQRVAEDLRAVLGETVDVLGFDQAPDVAADLLVNATPLGRSGETLPLPPLGPAVTAVDLLYPVETPFQAATTAAGGRAFDGLGLLVRQAARSFRIWWKVDPPLGAMQAAAERAVKGLS